MLHDEVYEMLCRTGLEVFYRQTGEPVSPPYIVYYLNGCEAYGSDFSNGIKKDSYVIEFYSSKKDAVNQGKIEKVLDNNVIIYSTNFYSSDMFCRIFCNPCSGAKFGKCIAIPCHNARLKNSFFFCYKLL